MKKLDFTSVRTLIAIDNQIVRRGVLDALKHVGFRNCAEAGSQVAFQEASDKSSFDLIIMVAELSGFPMAPLINEIRHGKANHHPFPVIMMLLPNGEKDYVRSVIDCGPDYILLMPVAPGPVLVRIEEATVNRKNFVVTFDYVGPDRRKEFRPGTEQLPQFEVPNPIHARVAGVSDAGLTEQINHAKIRLYNLRMDRYAVQSRWLGSNLKSMFHQNEADAAKLPAFGARMKQIARDLPSLLRFDMNEGIASLLGTIDSGADTLLRDGPDMNRDLLDRLASDCTRLGESVGKLLSIS